MPGFFNFRPEGYQYPIGLTTKLVGGSTVNVATGTTGGTQTVDGKYDIYEF